MSDVTTNDVMLFRMATGAAMMESVRLSEAGLQFSRVLGEVADTLQTLIGGDDEKNIHAVLKEHPSVADDLEALRLIFEHCQSLGSTLTNLGLPAIVVEAASGE